MPQYLSNKVPCVWAKRQIVPSGSHGTAHTSHREAADSCLSKASRCRRNAYLKGIGSCHHPLRGARAPGCACRHTPGGVNDEPVSSDPCCLSATAPVLSPVFSIAWTAQGDSGRACSRQAGRPVVCSVRISVVNNAYLTGTSAIHIAPRGCIA
jgi:hypothetical protein